ncbi:hypothetical protein QQM79_15790 [Marinobacteraceae bacterium S3BR75-40.1]
MEFCNRLNQPTDYVDVEVGPENWHHLEERHRLGPELRIVVLLLERLHASDMAYPFREPDDLMRLLPASKIVLGGVEIARHDIAAFLEPAMFPLRNDAMLAKAVYLAIVRCKAAMRWSSAGNRSAAIRTLVTS